MMQCLLNDISYILYLVVSGANTIFIVVAFRFQYTISMIDFDRLNFDPGNMNKIFRTLQLKRVS